MVIAWLSKHNPTPSQRAELVRLFGPHTLRTDADPFESAQEIARRIREMHAQEVVCVAPLAMLKRLLEFGVSPIIADMEQCRVEEAEVSTPSYRAGRFYRFRKFRRLKSITMEYEDLLPCRDETNGTDGE